MNLFQIIKELRRFKLSKAHRKYLREQNILYDKQQLTINTLKPIKNSLRPRLSLNIEQTVICPFCLHKGKLLKFLVSVKRGFHRRLGECPECKHKAWFETLLTIPNFTAKQFAEWVFDYGREFWSKCSFEKFRNRLYYDKDYTRIFWGRYRELKGEYDE